MRSKHVRGRAVSLAWAAVGGALYGCAAQTQGPASPEATLVAFSRALGESNLEAAYALMSDEYRREVSFAAFSRSLADNSQEVVETSNALSHVRGPARVEARFDYQARGDLVLVRDGERWSIATDVARFYDQSTPSAALRAFVRALERRRYDVLLRLVPNADKEGMTTASLEQTWGGSERDEVERILENLGSHLHDPIEITGDRATLAYGQRMRVQFLREDGLWKIEDPE